MRNKMHEIWLLEFNIWNIPKYVEVNSADSVMPIKANMNPAV